MPGLAERAKSLHARVAETEGSSKTRVPTVRNILKTTDMTVVTEQACTERAEHKARTAQLEGDVHEFKCELNVFETL